MFPLRAILDVLAGGGMWRVACGLWLMMLCFLYIVAGGAKNNVKGTLYSRTNDHDVATLYRRVILFATVDDVVDSCSRREHNSWAKRSWFAAAAAQDVAAAAVPVTVGSCCIASGKLRQTPNQRALLQACDYKRQREWSPVSHSFWQRTLICKLTIAKSRFHCTPHWPSQSGQGRSRL